ncbi:MAG: M20/M25/M40 family metallo-hydrolase [Solirubrobacteraceae bacterium]
MTRAGEWERRRLAETFERLCRIPSPSGSEQACAEMLSTELREIGCEVTQDEAGNLLARRPVGDAEPLLFCAHMDTVPLAAPVSPVLEDGCWRNANPGVLGADNKAAVAVMLEAARHRDAGALELLFTVEEERALAGIKAFDAGRLRSRTGFVFDHASPIGEIVSASPTYFRLEATLTGAAAHAGIRPELGRSAVLAAARAVSAMQLGRIDEATTANIGVIGGGHAANVVPDRCRIEGEARSLDGRRAEETVTAMVACLQDAAHRPDCECDLDVVVAQLFSGYRMPAASAAMGLARAALRDCGYEPRAIASGGGSDANVLLERGIDCVNLANGTERNHQPDERVSVAALEGMLDVALALMLQRRG